jgi:hypothetical protein
MTTSLLVWRTLLKSARNASIHDTRIKVSLAFLLVLNLGIGIWASNQLALRLQHWRTEGPAAVQTGLWQICLFTWLGTGLFSLLSIQRTVGGDEALLLFTLPIAPATRFRTLFGSFFIGGLWSVALLQICVTSYVLVSVVGWQGLFWLLLLQIGNVLVVLCMLIAALLVLRYLLSPGWVKIRVIAMLLVGVLLSLIAFRGSGIARSSQALLLWLRPEPVILLFILLLVVLLGPLAERIGELYSTVFTRLQAWGRSRNAFTLPGAHSMRSIFGRRRGLTAALFARAIVSQSRNMIFWLRLLVVLIVFSLFPLVRAALSSFALSNTCLAALYAAGLAIAHILEPAPGAISGEGNRLSLYLTTPYKPAHIVRAKLTVVLLPILGEGLTMGLFLCWRLGLTFSQTSFVILATGLMITSCTTLLVLGSVWDEDLNLAVEGAVQTLLQEEAPLTPRRMALLSITIVCLSTMFLLLWRLPGALALPTLGILTVAIVISMWNFSCAHMRLLLRKG